MTKDVTADEIERVLDLIDHHTDYRICVAEDFEVTEYYPAAREKVENRLKLEAGVKE